MADNKAKIEMTADSEAVIRALQKVEKGFDRVTDKMDRMERTTRKNTRANNDLLNGAVKGATAFAGALGIVTTGIGAINAAAGQLRREYDNLISRQKSAADENLGFEASLAQAVRNSKGIFGAEEVRARSIEMARRTGVTPARAASTIGSAVTSTGVTNKAEAQLAVQAAEDALAFAPDLDASGVEAISGVSASLAKRFNVKPSAAIGFVQRVGGQANIRELTPLIENLAPVIANLTDFGFTPNESGALASSITQGTSDVTGEMSGTAAINMAKSLSDMVKALPKRFPGLSVDGTAIVDQQGQAAAGRALQVLTDDPKLREFFFTGGKMDGVTLPAASIGKGKAEPTITGIMTPGHVSNRQFAGSKEAIGGFTEGQTTFDELIADIASVTPVSQANRRLRSGASQIRTADRKGATASVAREGLMEVLKAAGISDAEQRLALAAFEAESGISEDRPIESAIGALESRASRLRTSTTRFVGGDPLSGVPGAPVEVKPSAGQLQQSQQLQSIADTLKAIHDDQRRRDPPAQRRQPAAAALGRR